MARLNGLHMTGFFSPPTQIQRVFCMVWLIIYRTFFALQYCIQCTHHFQRKLENFDFDKTHFLIIIIRSLAFGTFGILCSIIIITNLFLLNAFVIYLPVHLLTSLTVAFRQELLFTDFCFHFLFWSIPDRRRHFCEERKTLERERVCVVIVLYRSRASIFLVLELEEEIPSSQQKALIITTTMSLIYQAKWSNPTITMSIVGIVTMMGLAIICGKQNRQEQVSIAMIGNSIQYFNDLPRLLETLSDGHLTQDSCLHGGANFATLVTYGNGMYYKWATGNAEINSTLATEGMTYDDDEVYDENYKYSKLYDWGACTVPQLLLGKDDVLDDIMQERRRRRRMEEQQDENGDDDDDNNNDDYNYDNNNDDYNYDDNDDAVDEDADGDDDNAGDDDYYYYQDYESFGLDDGLNPCLQNEEYYWYLQRQYELNGAPKWDYILLNDNSRNPCCSSQREEGLAILESFYIPIFFKTKAIPIFLDTHAYWASTRDMSGLTDIPTFTSLTYSGYQEYADLVAIELPPSQKPRIAPVGLALLMIYEEHPEVYEGMIHYDEIHLSASGTLLEAMIVHATIFGKLPDPSLILDTDDGVANLWKTARRMVPQEDLNRPFPSESLAQYLYHIAHRVVVLGEKPKSFQEYYPPNYKSVYFIPEN